VCMGDQNPFKDRISEEITLFTSVDKIPGVDLSRRTKVWNL
jgi:hypothetical protein